MATALPRRTRSVKTSKADMVPLVKGRNLKFDFQVPSAGVAKGEDDALAQYQHLYFKLTVPWPSE
jgi:hypothetical protein